MLPFVISSELFTDFFLLSFVFPGFINIFSYIHTSHLVGAAVYLILDLFPALVNEIVCAHLKPV